MVVMKYSLCLKKHLRILKQLSLELLHIRDTPHHKQWYLDQIIRALTGCPMVQKTYICNQSQKTFKYDVQGESSEYIEFVRSAKDGEDGADTYGWDVGIPP